MNKKVLCLGLIAGALFSSCKKDNAVNPSLKTSARIMAATSAQTLQGASLYNGYTNDNGNYTTLLGYDFVDALPYCLGGSCAAYASYQVYIRKNNSSTFEGPYTVTDVVRTSNYYYPGQSIHVLRAWIPVPQIQTGSVYGMPIYSYVPRSGLYYICLVAPGTTPTMNQPDPTQQLLVTFGDDNL